MGSNMVDFADQARLRATSPPTHPFPIASPDANITLTQNLGLTQGAKQGPILQ